MLPPQDFELLPKSQVFQEEISARGKKSGKEKKKGPQQAQHKASLTCEKAELDSPSKYLIR
jgi:hypothetical protein